MFLGEIGFIKMGKASRFVDCERWFNNRNNVRNVEGSPTDVLRMSESMLYGGGVDVRTRAAFGIAIGSKSIRQRIDKAKDIFVELVYSNPDLIEAFCAAQNPDEVQGGVPFTMNDVVSMFKQLAEEAKKLELERTMSELLEREVPRVIENMRQTQERGDVYKQALKKEVKVDSPSTGYSFKYSPSGVPLVKLGGLYV